MRMEELSQEDWKLIEEMNSGVGANAKEEAVVLKMNMMELRLMVTMLQTYWLIQRFCLGL